MLPPTRPGGGFPCDGRQARGVQGVSGEWTGQIAGTVQGGVQRGGALHLRFDDVVAELVDRERRTRAARDGAVFDGIAVGGGEREELVVEFGVGKLELADPVEHPHRVVQGAAQLLGDGVEIAWAGHRVEPAEPDVDRVDRASADLLHQPVAGLLQRQSALDELRVVPGEADAVGIEPRKSGACNKTMCRAWLWIHSPQ